MDGGIEGMSFEGRVVYMLQGAPGVQGYEVVGQSTGGRNMAKVPDHIIGGRERGPVASVTA